MSAALNDYHPCVGQDCNKSLVKVYKWHNLYNKPLLSSLIYDLLELNASLIIIVSWIEKK